MGLSHVCFDLGHFLPPPSLPTFLCVLWTSYSNRVSSPVGLLTFGICLFASSWCQLCCYVPCISWKWKLALEAWIKPDLSFLARMRRRCLTLPHIQRPRVSGYPTSWDAQRLHWWLCQYHLLHPLWQNGDFLILSSLPHLWAGIL